MRWWQVLEEVKSEQGQSSLLLQKENLLLTCMSSLSLYLTIKPELPPKPFNPNPKA